MSQFFQMKPNKLASEASYLTGSTKGSEYPRVKNGGVQYVQAGSQKQLMRGVSSQNVNGQTMFAVPHSNIVRISRVQGAPQEYMDQRQVNGRQSTSVAKYTSQKVRASQYQKKFLTDKHNIGYAP